MDIKDIFKIDSWWKCVLLCGILFVASSLICNVDFIDKKNIFGLGIGLTAIGIGYWITQETVLMKFY